MPFAPLRLSIIARVGRAARARPGRAPATWLAPLAAIVLVFLVALYTNVRDRERAYRLARAEVRARLEAGEHVLREVRALQRRWYDLFRATYGVLAATDRRVLFVGVVPELYTSSDAPRAFDLQAFEYGAAFRIAPITPPLGAVGVLVASGAREQRFRIPATERAPLQTLIATATRRAGALVEALRREQRFRDSIAALPPIREYHRVRPGDALEAIAKRYGTTAEHIRELNGLPSDRILVGQELLVRETPRPIPPCPPSICGIVAASGGEIQPAPGSTQVRPEHPRDDRR